MTGRSPTTPRACGRLRAGAAAALLALCLGCSRAPRHGSAVLITLDTTRRDALGVYGGSAAARTPHLDALAARGVVFERAHTVVPLTLPSHASMLTGVYPPRHGLRDNGYGILPPSIPTVAEGARAAGFQTGAFVAAVVLDGSFGLARGFDVYAAPDPDGEATTHVASLPGARIVADARAWLRELDPDRPFFLWVHFFDPHAPYEPSEEGAAMNGGNAYLGEVSDTDAHVGAVLATLDELGLEASVLVVADHGESLGEHGEKTHGFFLYEGALAVPFLLARADGARAGEREALQASVVDVAPTLADALGIEPAPGMDGRSLWEPLPDEERGVYFECYAGHLSFGWSPAAGWVAGDRKYVHSSRPELYDLAADPDERTNRFAGDADVSAAVAAIGRVAGRLPPEGEVGEIDADLLGDINALGYSALGRRQELPHPLEATDAPSPHTQAEEMLLTQYATRQFNSGDVEPALRSFDSILARNPGNLRALGMRVNCLIALGREEEAVEPLQRFLARMQGSPDDHYNLGVCLRAAGREDEAVESFRVALRLARGEPEWAPGVVELLERRGLAEDVRAWRERQP